MKGKPNTREAGVGVLGKLFHDACRVRVKHTVVGFCVQKHICLMGISYWFIAWVRTRL